MLTKQISDQLLPAASRLQVCVTDNDTWPIATAYPTRYEHCVVVLYAI